MKIFRTEHAVKLGAALVVLASVIVSRYAVARPSVPDTRLANGEIRSASQLPKDASYGFQPRSANPIYDGGAPSTVSQGVTPELSPEPRAPAAATPQPKNAKPHNALSDQQIFNLQHPPYYLGLLSRLQDFMVGDQFLKPSEKQAFTSEDTVLSFWHDRAFDYLVSRDILTPSDRRDWNNGIALVKTFHAEEGVGLRAGISPLKEDTFLSSVIKGITDFLPPSKASAQTCFSPGAPTATPGINLIAPCCACYIFGAPIGCLNLICAGRPAIFDETTFICGCGI